MKIAQPSVTLVHFTADPATVVQTMGSICYQSEPKRAPDDFVAMLLERGHESVLEHVSLGVRIVTDRGVTHELVRHRIAAFSQESTRYCNYTGERFGGELTFIEPPGLNDGPLGTYGSRFEWFETMRKAEASYANMIASGSQPQIARGVLPNSLKAEIGMSCNAREWRHVCRLRLSPKAHPQMQEVMRLVLPILLAWFPVAFEEFSEPSE